MAEETASRREERDEGTLDATAPTLPDVLSDLTQGLTAGLLTSVLLFVLGLLCLVARERGWLVPGVGVPGGLEAPPVSVPVLMAVQSGLIAAFLAARVTVGEWRKALERRMRHSGRPSA